ncbi:hypothetical protein [Nonomuraea africana]|uniref:ABC transporter ATP-binding protein n=1 Tax=Nonomuraea africana TaxID=46171 RepID=A0ABR9KD14_9ACTN|nr:hypothetical protein [Nonomuraea africana]MBE1559891.1 hypothetical protein [Nonomuraea africana]
MIRVEGLTKVFRRPRTFTGPFGAVRTRIWRAQLLHYQSVGS